MQESLASSYTLERELGGGGMSRVFVAQEHRLGRKVVVKLLAPELAAALSATRFEREIQVAASLQQANIVPVLAAGEVDGLPYYTMPFVEGESLRARLGRGPLTIAEVVSILRDVSRALAYAHEHGVVHRDIKPDNVLLSGHTAVVTDFGIAKAIAAAAQGPAGATLTQLGTAVGTPMYMAPEQAAGDPATDHRADIYAFGCMAYELITGQAPFAGLTPHRLLVAHMSESPKPVADLRPDCPPALASLVMQCVAKEPGSRPAGATELLQRLDAVTSPSGSGAAVPAILMGGRNMLWRALAIYAGAFVAVAIVARAAIIAIGLPDWVFPGALVVMALGLPVVLFTAYTQYVARRAAAATPTFTPGGSRSLTAGEGTMATLAIKAMPHVSWKRTARGGIIAVGAFILLITGWMVTRALGIGPAASLLSSGKLSASDRVVVAAFDAPGADSSLGSTIAEAVKTNLSQSSAVHVMPTSAVVATLEQMQRPDTARVDYATAREIAQRSGAKAVVTGSIVPAGSGYIITAKLVEATSGNDLASYTESAKDAGDLIAAVDRVTKSLRGKIGESLKSVHDAPRLDQVTTASLGALKSYTAGLFANDVQGDYPAAIQHFRDAIRQDSTFAMAWVQLVLLAGVEGRHRFERGSGRGADPGFPAARPAAGAGAGQCRGGVLLAGGERPEEGDSGAAARGGARLHQCGRGQQPRHRPLQYARLCRRRADVPAGDRGRSGERHADHQPGDPVHHDGAACFVRFGDGGGWSATASPSPPRPPVSPSCWPRHQYDSAEALARAGADTARPANRPRAQEAVIQLAVLHGRLREAERMYPAWLDATARLRGDSVSPYQIAYWHAMVDGALRGNTARATAMLDSTLRAHPVASEPLERDQSQYLALAYALMGDAAKARTVMSQHVARLDSLGQTQQYLWRVWLQGATALAEGKTDSAIVYYRQSDFDADGLPMNRRHRVAPPHAGPGIRSRGQARLGAEVPHPVCRDGGDRSL